MNNKKFSTSLVDPSFSNKLAIIDPLHKWRLNLNDNSLYVLSLVLMFQDKGFFLHECEAKDV